MVLRLKFAFHFWLRVFLVGLIGLSVFALVLHNPFSVEIAAYGEKPFPWFLALIFMIIRSVPYLLVLTAIFFPLGLIFYHPKSSEEEKSKKFTFSSLNKKTMVPAYFTTTATWLGIYLFGSSIDKSGMGALVFMAMTIFLLFMLVPINIYVWIVSISHSRETQE